MRTWEIKFYSPVELAKFVAELVNQGTVFEVFTEVEDVDKYSYLVKF